MITYMDHSLLEMSWGRYKNCQQYYNGKAEGTYTICTPFRVFTVISHMVFI